jgi:hypothetical protein
MARTLPYFTLAFALPLFTACGGSEPPPQAPEVQTSEDDDEDNAREVGAMAEIGAMPEEETVAAFQGALDPIQKCFIDGARRIEFLGGQISLKVLVGERGKVKGVFAEQSTLGDRETEKCMLQALEHASWPAPVGGLVGIAQSPFEFEMTGDVRAPVALDDFNPDEALSAQSAALRDCKGSVSGSFSATVYIDTDGSPLAAGISAPNAEADAKSDCLVSVLKQAKFPSPGSWPGKATFSL